MECAVCLEIITDPATLNCKHVFCAPCCMIVNLICPLCRTQIESYTLNNNQVLTPLDCYKNIMCIILTRLFKRKHQLLRFLRSMRENDAGFLFRDIPEIGDKILTASEAHDRLLYGYAVFSHLAQLYDVHVTVNAINYHPNSADVLHFNDIDATINTSNM